MKYKVVVSAEVVSQILSASAYYEGIRDGLGAEFEQKVDDRFTSLARFPALYPKEFADIRRAYLKRYKQVVFYIVRGDSVVVLEVRDARREPPDWNERGFQDN